MIMAKVNVTSDTPTRDRLISAALELFAAKGFKATTVGEIEAAAGLAPRRGGLYNHFASKEVLLDAAVDRHVAEIDRLQPVLAGGARLAGDVRTELTLLARWVLQERKRERALLRIMQQESDTFPELAATIRDRIVEPGYRQAAGWIRARIAAGGFPDYDAEAIAVVALGSLAAYALQRETFGRAPLRVGEDRFVETWVETWARVADTAEAERS
jgi:AcrR family transcriptional regulator